MTDTHSQEIRSYNMSRIRSKNTKPELTVRNFLLRKRFKFKLYDSKLPGNPDIVLPKRKIVIFVHGCFWHGHKGCKRFVMPKSKRRYWVPKINKNVFNFKQHKRNLKKLGWKVLTVWECQLKRVKVKKTLLNLTKKIRD